MIGCVVAVEKGGGIGYNGSMPWPKLSDDMEWFKTCTYNSIVLMGSKTWESLKKPLEGRVNVVISSKLQVKANLTFSDPLEAITELQKRFPKKNIYVIGGEKIYESLKSVIDTYYVTEVDQNYTCDRFFDLDFVKNNFPIVSELIEIESTDNTPSYKIKEYIK